MYNISGEYTLKKIIHVVGDIANYKSYMNMNYRKG
jgi:hypothetical protein